MGVVSRSWVWVESMGVVVRRYIDILILLIPAPLVSAFFGSIPTFCSFFKCFCSLLGKASALGERTRVLHRWFYIGGS